ncbi:MAG: type II secretion system F family protein [Candidatus Pacebacteria bacterium]|nr:type II secretion system F family protein [Candidatus Paceibacterota bacterium]
MPITLLQKLNHPPLSQKEQGIFAERLAMLLGASLPLPESIEMMCRSFGKRRSAQFRELESALSGGASFESALSDSALGISRTLVLAARIGEKSGTLSESLVAAAGRIERRRAVQSGLVSALAYPLVIFLASVGIIVFLVFFIMPKIMPTLESLHVPLPLVTRFFIYFSHLLADDWWKIAISIVVCATIALFEYKRSAKFRDLMQWSILCVPILSHIVRAHALSEMFDAISTLVSAGCPLIEAISECSAFVALVPYRAALLHGAREMQIGSTFSSAISAYPRLFPSLAVDSLAIGERTGNMEAVLSEVSRYYARELAAALTAFGKMIEPALMIAVGIIVGAAALSIVMPIYSISQHLSG